MSLLVVATHGCGANNGYGLLMAQESTALVRICVQPATVLAVLTCFFITYKHLENQHIRIQWFRVQGLGFNLLFVESRIPHHLTHDTRFTR